MNDAPAKMKKLAESPHREKTPAPRNGPNTSATFNATVAAVKAKICCLPENNSIANKKEKKKRNAPRNPWANLHVVWTNLKQWNLNSTGCCLKNKIVCSINYQTWTSTSKWLQIVSVTKIHERTKLETTLLQLKSMHQRRDLWSEIICACECPIVWA